MLKPIKFKGQNVVYAEDQDQYISLPGYRVPYSAHSEEGKRGNFVTCWKFSFKDRIRILFGKPLWFEVWTFWDPLQPVKLTIDKNETSVPDEKAAKTDH